MDKLGFLVSVFRWLPPLRKHKNPTLALVIGFALGGIGLGIYFLSLIDFFIPIAIVIALGSLVGAYGILGGALVAALYGYARAASSNQRLEAQKVIAAGNTDPASIDVKNRGAVRLADLVDAAILMPGSRLCAERGTTRYEATVTAEGTLELPGGERATSLSGAAKLAYGRRANGWNFWKVQTNTGAVPIAALRDELVKMRRARPARA